MNYFFVFIGAGLGGMARHALNMVALRTGWAQGFPVGTLTINVVGSLLMGMVVEWLVQRMGATHAGLRLFLTTGILGGFTTFSAFSLETVMLFERGQLMLAVLYVVASVVLSVLALWAGMALMRLA
ncbi:MAG: fluoride efflux transporter CrcB [Corticimicrobacter sp.]|uniref:fluoride efflux transporter CrcB n=1 Tax=Corticimicrobacter sp. TaxID=2678536 RepID=UPI0032D9BC8F